MKLRLAAEEMHLLIEHEKILEGNFPMLADLSGKKVKAFLMALSRLPGVLELPQDKPEIGGSLKRSVFYRSGSSANRVFTTG